MRIFRLVAECEFHAESPEQAIDMLHRTMREKLGGKDTDDIKDGTLLFFEFVPTAPPGTAMH